MRSLLLLVAVLACLALASASLDTFKVRLRAAGRQSTDKHRRHHHVVKETTLADLKSTLAGINEKQLTLGLEMELAGSLVGLRRFPGRPALPGDYRYKDYPIGVFYDDLIAQTKQSAQTVGGSALPLLRLMVDAPGTLLYSADVKESDSFSEVVAAAQRAGHKYSNDMTSVATYGAGGRIEIVTGPIPVGDDLTWNLVRVAIGQFADAYNNAHQGATLRTILNGLNNVKSPIVTWLPQNLPQDPDDFRRSFTQPHNYWAFTKIAPGKIASGSAQLSYALPLSTVGTLNWVNAVVPPKHIAYPGWNKCYSVAEKFMDGQFVGEQFKGANTPQVRGLIALFFFQTWADEELIQGTEEEKKKYIYDSGSSKTMVSQLVKSCPDDILRAPGILTSPERSALAAYALSLGRKSNMFWNMARISRTGNHEEASINTGNYLTAFKRVFLPRRYKYLRYPGETDTDYGLGVVTTPPPPGPSVSIQDWNDFSDTTNPVCKTRTSKPLQPFDNGGQPYVVVESRSEKYPWVKEFLFSNIKSQTAFAPSDVRATIKQKLTPLTKHLRNTKTAVFDTAVVVVPDSVVSTTTVDEEGQDQETDKSVLTGAGDQSIPEQDEPVPAEDFLTGLGLADPDQEVEEEQQ